MKSRLFSLAISFLFALSLWSAPIGFVRGYVKDSSGAFVPNAAVELRSVDTNVATRTTTDSNGYFQFLQVNPGAYAVTAEAQGFRKTQLRQVNVLVDQIVSLEVQLEVGQITETISVSDAITALIEPERIATIANIEPKYVANLPIANRRFNDLALLTPGATFSASGAQVGGIAAAGSRVQSTNWLIDGVNALDPQVNGPLNTLRIADAIQEFSVTTTASSAEFGRQSGAQVNVVTKSGTNKFRGTAFWFLRNDKLQAADFFTNKLGGTKNTLRRNQYGATLGGPVRRDKTFFFYSWEGLKQSNPTPVAIVVPTQAQRETVRDPVARNLLQFYPLPTDPTVPVGRQNFVGNYAQRSDDNTHLVRIDHQLSQNDRLSGRYIRFGGQTLAAVVVAPNFGTTNTPGTQTLSVTETHVFSPTFFTEIRAGYSRNATEFNTEDFGFNAASVFAGVPGVVDGARDGLVNTGLPRVTVTGYASLGGATNLPQGRITNTYELFVNSTKVAPFGFSRSTLKFGYNARRDETRRFLNGNSRGSIGFSSFDNFAGSCSTCDGRALINTSTIRTGDTLAHWYRYPHSLYVQNDIRVKPNFTLNLGLRWEYFAPNIEKHGRGTNFIEGVGAVLIGTNRLLDLDPNRRGRDAFIYRDAPFTLSRSGIDSDRNNFGPVAGFAYSPRFGPGWLGDGKTVLRGGFRIGFDEVFNNIPVNQTLNAPWVLTTTQRAGLTQPAAGYRWDLAFNQDVPLVARTTQGPGAPAVGLVGFNAADLDGATTYAMNWNFGIQRELTSTSSFEISYIGSGARKLGLYLDLNEPTVVVRDPGLRGALAPNEQVFPFRQWATAFNGSMQGSSSFHGLVASGKIRLRNLLTLNSSYTWSHSIDNTSAFFASDDDLATPTTRRRLDLERGNGGNDQRHRFISFFVFDAPVGRNRRFLGNTNGFVDAILGGWSVSGVWNLVTGHPFTVVANTALDFSGFNQFGDRPDIAGSGPLTVDRGDPDNFFDPAYFGKVATNFCPGSTTQRVTAGCSPTGRTGGSARNGYYGPGVINFDMTASKSFSLSEQVKLQYRAEFFNLFNHTNFALVAGNRSMSTGTFGQLGTTAEINGGLTGGPRIIQMTLRLTF